MSNAISSSFVLICVCPTAVIQTVMNTIISIFLMRPYSWGIKLSR